MQWIELGPNSESGILEILGVAQFARSVRGAAGDSVWGLPSGEYELKKPQAHSCHLFFKHFQKFKGKQWPRLPSLFYHFCSWAIHRL